MNDRSVDLPIGLGGPIGPNPSFFDLVSSTHPELLARAPGTSGEPPDPAAPSTHGTTVLGLKFADGVVMSGDRRATEGFSVADDRMDKVFAADDWSAIAIAGAAGQAVEIVKLFQLELEHYEKITGDRLSLEGKANRLGQMIRGNFPLAIQGLVVVPLFGGFDLGAETGRIFYYDATGGRWEEHDYHATGSGGRAAKGSLKKQWRPGLSQSDAIEVAVEALLDASQEDVATGGPDPARGIWPTTLVVTRDGVGPASEEELRTAYETVLASRPTQESG